MQLISINNSNKQILVDDIDYARVLLYKWQLSPKGTIYASCKGHIRNIGPFILDFKTDSRIQIDHIDRDIFNNQRTNLRVCTQSQNMGNISSHKDSISKYKGVTWDKNRNLWKADIMKNHISYYLGRFEDEKEAAKVYNAKALRLFGKFANLNIIE